MSDTPGLRCAAPIWQHRGAGTASNRSKGEQMPRWLGRPSPATVMSAIALFVSLGGVGYAAATIGSAQIVNNSVSSRDIKNRTIRSKDISKKAVSALRGRKGAKGERGPAGERGAT